MLESSFDERLWQENLKNAELQDKLAHKLYLF